MKTFIQSQFIYSPVVWMCHNRTLNIKINRLHERALRIVYKNTNLTFQELLEKYGLVTMHKINYEDWLSKCKNKKSSLTLTNARTIHRKNNKHDLRNKSSWEPCNVRTVSYRTDTIRDRKNMGTCAN